jgi:glucan phosphoethanolaminetransferase (alkaline phosphatase superfamily)
LLLTESVRASDFTPETAPLTHALFRLRFTQMRAVASYTALSLSALLTGLPQTGSRDAVLLAPDLFDYVHAWGSAHYWSAHSETVFEKKDVRRSLASFVTADSMLGHPIGDVEEAVAGGLDRRLASECTARFPTMRGPYVAMVHFSGTHAPYFFEEQTARFAPFSHAATWSGLDDLHRAYEDAIAEQDKSLSACARAFIDAQDGAPYWIILTSDHGEAFGEHAAIHHGQNLYDEQIHVPALALWGNGIDASELEQSKDAFVTHLDLVPTLLDAMGVLDHFAIAKDVAKMPGRSLLRPLPPMAPLPITNCSEMFPCPLSAWGVLGADRKLFAQPWDRQWKCLQVGSKEEEVPIERCADLERASHAPFPTLPNGDPN